MKLSWKFRRDLECRQRCCWKFRFSVIYSAPSAKSLPTFRSIVLQPSLVSSSSRTNRGATEDQDILCRQGCACGLKRRVTHAEQTNQVGYININAKPEESLPF